MHDESINVLIEDSVAELLIFPFKVQIAKYTIVLGEMKISFLRSVLKLLP